MEAFGIMGMSLGTMGFIFALNAMSQVSGLEVTYELEELGPTSTRLTQLSEVRFKHVFKLMGLLFGKKMEREGQQAQAENFARMKALIEEGASA